MEVTSYQITRDKSSKNTSDKLPSRTWLELHRFHHFHVACCFVREVFCGLAIGPIMAGNVFGWR